MRNIVLCLLLAGTFCQGCKKDPGLEPSVVGSASAKEKFSYSKLTAITVTTYAGGNGKGYQDGPRESSRFTDPYQVKVTSNGTLYIASMVGYDVDIRKISPSGIVSCFFRASSTWNGPMATAKDGSLYLPVMNLKTQESRLINIDQKGKVREITSFEAGTHISGLTISYEGIIYYTDIYKGTIHELSADGTDRVIARDLYQPVGAFIPPKGSPYEGRLFAISGSDIVQVDLKTKKTSLFYSFDLLWPGGDLVFTPDGAVIFSYGNSVAMLRDLRSQPSIIAGSVQEYGYVDSEANKARFSYPTGLALFGKELFVADENNHSIRKISLSW